MMDSQILTVILSGQLLLVAWQIYKEISDRKAKRKSQKDGLRDMVFSLFRDNLRQRIISLDQKLSTGEFDHVEAVDLKEDVKVYIHNNGNGLIKQLYIHLANKARVVAGEDAYVTLWIDGLDEHSSNS